MVIVPAFAGLGAPHWDPNARGVALGITRGTERAHFCRAALTKVAFQLATGTTTRQGLGKSCF